MKLRPFYWDDFNRDHATRHGVSREEAKYCVRTAKSPFPRRTRDGKYVVWGRSQSGRYIQVVFVKREISEVDLNQLTLNEMFEVESSPEPLIYIVHARELNQSEKFQFRRLR